MSMYDTEDRKMIKRTLALAEENNKILKKLHRSLKWSRFFRMIYWLVVLGITLGAYYYIQPYIDNTVSLFDSIKQTLGQIHSAPASETIKNASSTQMSSEEANGRFDELLKFLKIKK